MGGAAIQKARKTQMAPGVMINVTPDAEFPVQEFQSMLEVLVAFQISVHAWALTGTETTTPSSDAKITGLDGDVPRAWPTSPLCSTRR